MAIRPDLGNQIDGHSYTYTVLEEPGKPAERREDHE